MIHRLINLGCQIAVIGAIAKQTIDKQAKSLVIILGIGVHDIAQLDQSSCKLIYKRQNFLQYYRHMLVLFEVVFYVSHYYDFKSFLVYRVALYGFHP